MNKYNDSKEIILSSTCLLLSIAHADDNIDKSELKIIDEIIKDFFNLEDKESQAVIIDAQEDLKQSTDYFSYGNQLNEYFSLTEKIDFISCIFEVAYSDGTYHYMEEHMIKKIAHMLHVENKDLVNVKMDIKRLFNLD
tara:strand:- start:4617 stop:5030 length:414 start_codon:yes stop_codon:yes gene_type:complete